MGGKQLRLWHHFIMPTTICPHCEAKTHMTVVWGEHRPPVGYGHLAAKCDACRSVVAARYWFGPSQTGGYTTPLEVSAAFDRLRSVRVDWYPKRGFRKEIEDVPEPIKSVAEEAHEAASIGCNRAAILLARSVVEATAKHHGITTGNLLSKIDTLAEKNIIRGVIASAAHEVRHAGNDMAHGDFDVDVTQEDADALLSIMDMVLSEVFQVESLVKRLSSKRKSD